MLNRGLPNRDNRPGAFTWCAKELLTEAKRLFEVAPYHRSPNRDGGRLWSLLSPYTLSVLQQELCGALTVADFVGGEAVV